MARRSKEEILTEFHRLSDVFEAAQDVLSDLDPWSRKTRNLLISRSSMLGFVEDGRATPSQILAGAREALNDISDWLRESDEALKFLDLYRAQTGRNFYDDAGDPLRTVRAILKRGRILDDTEYRLLGAFCGDLEQKGLSKAQLQKAEQLLADYVPKVGE